MKLSYFLYFRVKTPITNHNNAFIAVTKLEKYKSSVNIATEIALRPTPSVNVLIKLNDELLDLIISYICSAKEKIKIVFASAITISCQIITILNATHL